MESDKEILARLKKQKPAPEVELAIAKETELPEIEINEENCITVDGKLIEIRPTLLKYFRNNSVSFYRVLDTVPLPDIYRMTEERSGIDGYAATLTFISAVLDDAKLAKRIYTKMDASQLMRLVETCKYPSGFAEELF